MTARIPLPRTGRDAPGLSGGAPTALGQWFDQLKEQIDLHDLAARLGLKRQGKGNYHSPHHPDRHASLSIFADGRGWKDWSGDAGGSCIDLLRYCQPELDTPLAAARLLGDWYGLPQPKPAMKDKAAPVRKSTLDYIGERCLAQAEAAIAYLTGRGIDEAVIRRALRCKTLGWNDWHSAKIAAGEVGHGGAAVAFLVRSGGRLAAVDLRYVDPALNGGVKTQCQGAREGHGWCSDPQRLQRARLVYLVESPINALSVESCTPPDVAALALRGVGNVDSLDWTVLRGKAVRVALDHSDPVNPASGVRPGLAAAWRLSEKLTAADIGHLLVDMQDWDEGEDLNDVLRQHGADVLRGRLRKLEAWLLPGMPGGGERLEGTRRVQLPGHDWAVYWRFRVKEDFTQYVDEFKTDDDGNRSETLGDLCSFRVASLSRLRIQSHLATISGAADHQPETVFGVSAQLARHGVTLQREVATDDKLYNLEWWKSRFGAIWKPAQFQRLVNLMERAADLGARDVVNFVGLAWKAGALTAQEGQDCYFVEPQKQCLYYNLTFPRGSTQQARTVIQAYQDTFHHNAAAIPLVWALGAHLKTLLGFYPHFQMQAEKGSGKSKLLESLQTTLAFQVLSGQMLKTDHRRRASVSFTSQPVGWDEFSKLPKTVLSDIDALLQSTYRFEFTRVGASLTPYLMCAPVLLAGEEVDVQSLQSKLCRSSLSVARQGALIPHDLPVFPLWAWLQFLADVEPARLRDLHRHYLGLCERHSRAPTGDATARRMMENYAALLCSWALLCEFADLDPQQGGFIEDLMAEMNSHIVDTDGSRLPWVWIMEILLSELEARRFDYPHCWDRVKLPDGRSEMALFLRPNHVMDHLSTAPHLRAKFDALPVKTGRIFKHQLLQSPVVLADGVEKTIHGRRQGHLTAISLPQLEKLGLYAAPDIQP
ncbi:toprim domain-containing protein [Chromobacterium haemolyticum]|uniref:Toprim domain-containing protein n=2 Tax=Chromobacterium TaxID=535 RepID=A0ABS3GKG0_9NEIS|nr:toprim domain-containing protein [Chromobacterium haemolyticum]MBK0415888.1 toprim domain-containing protein [Chromobacterium haemolyticum]MBO0415115.1 toprim domain-containing protein [Chromobacterium haemolyticum]MBO0498376.1 toprim domain-containing protein [Chromobacterium haemolyticum]